MPFVLLYILCFIGLIALGIWIQGYPNLFCIILGGTLLAFAFALNKALFFTDAIISYVSSAPPLQLTLIATFYFVFSGALSLGSISAIYIFANQVDLASTIKITGNDQYFRLRQIPDGEYHSLSLLFFFSASAVLFTSCFLQASWFGIPAIYKRVHNWLSRN